MQDHGLVAEVDERLGHAERERPQAGAEASDENERLHGCGGSPPPNSALEPVRNAASSRKHGEIEILRSRSDPDIATELRDNSTLSPGPPAYADAMCDVPQHRAHPGGSGMEATRLPLIRRYAGPARLEEWPMACFIG